MHENKFEKEVREKMDQLGFDPSDTVWANVDKEINKDQNRRRPIFWLTLSLVLVLSAGSYYFILYKTSTNFITGKKQIQEKGKSQDKQSAGKNEIGIGERNKKNEGVRKLTAGLAVERTKQNNVQTGKAPENKEPGKPVSQVDQHAKRLFNGKVSGDEKDLKSAKESEITSSEAMNSRKPESRPPGQSSVADWNDAVLNENSEDSESKTKPDRLEKTSVDSSALKRINRVVENKDSVSDKNLGKPKDQKIKSSPWKIGFAGNAGISNINQSLFKGVYGSTFSNNPGSVTGAPTGAPAAGTASKFHAGFSFDLGVFAEKHLSKRISFSAGINYHYYSANIRTGNFVDSSASGQGSVVNRYYRSGDNHVYTNKYHFVELPLTINFQVNKSRKMPVIWEAGMSLSYLASSNALNFDPYGNVYFENNHLINRTQLNGVNAIMVGFHFSHSELQLGPQFQYGLTGLLKSGESSSQHLFYYGLKFSFIPGKK